MRVPNTPDRAVRRSNLRRLLLDKGLRIVAVDAVEVSEQGPSEGPSEALPRQGVTTLADLSTCDRIGLKGRDSTRWLEGRGIALPARPNRLQVRDDGLVVARYGDAEYLVATFRSTRSDVIAELRADQESTRPAGCHAVPRVDGQAAFGLAGVGCVASLSGLCPADLRPVRFGPQDILQTLCAGVSAQVLNLSADGAPRIVVLCDASYAHHLFSALSDAVSSAGGAITAQSAWFHPPTRA